MITVPAAFLVHGDPIQQGSMKCVGRHTKGSGANVQPDNKPALTPWRNRVAAGAQEHLSAEADEHQPIGLIITYSLARPGYHYGTGRNEGQIKPSHLHDLPTKFGTRDIDKLERAILDSLQASGVLVNDAQVVEVTHKKRFVHNAPTMGPDHRDVLPMPGVVVRLYPIDGDE